MNPLNLPGPEFLAFYAALAIVVLVLMVVARRINEFGELPVLNNKDPLLIACLRGGPPEVVRVATMGLLDRGILKMQGTLVQTVSSDRAAFGQPRIERDIAEHFRSEASLDGVYGGAALVSAGSYETTLQRLRLIPDDDILRYRGKCFVLALLVLLGVGGAKLVNALMQGRSNIWFLAIMMVVAVLMAWKLSGGYRTRMGDRYLANMRSLFVGLRKRAASLRPGSGTRELLWLTALFGAAAVPANAYPFAKYFQPAPKSNSSCSGGSSSCSSGGSSCGGGGSSGCGGCGGGGD